MVLATAVPKVKAATKLKKAAQTTPCSGVSTRVETTVAIELAASWKPLTKSKASATAMIRMTEIRVESGIGDHHPLDDVAGIFDPVGGLLEQLVDLFPADEVKDIFAVGHQAASGRLPAPGRRCFRWC